MSRFPIMRSLDPHHQRVGYIGALVLVTSRGLNTKEAIRTGLENLLFERIYMDDPRLESVLRELSSERRKKHVLFPNVGVLPSVSWYSEHPASVKATNGKLALPSFDAAASKQGPVAAINTSLRIKAEVLLEKTRTPPVSVSAPTTIRSLAYCLITAGGHPRSPLVCLE